MLEEYQLRIIKTDKHHIYYTTINDDYAGILKVLKYKKDRFLADLKDGITPYQWELMIEEKE